MTKKNSSKFLWRFLCLVFFVIFGFGVFGVGVWAQTSDASLSNDSDFCSGGIRLNTNVPFIGNCIELSQDWESAGQTPGATTSVTPTNAFPVLIRGITNILFTTILIVAFLMVVVAGVMMTTGGASERSFKNGKKILKTVVIAIAALGLTGIILRLINPLFFQ